MTEVRKPGTTRRAFLSRTAGLAVAGGGAAVATAGAVAAQDGARGGSATEPFWGAHQGGIVTPPQRHTYFAVFDLTTDRRDEVTSLLQAWTGAAARLAAGLPIAPFAHSEPRYSYDPSATVTTNGDAPTATKVSLNDTGETNGLPAARLTITFGFGAGLFVKDGHDRYGLAVRRPTALVDLPHFVGDELVSEHSNGDLSVQCCADDPQVAFHAARQLARLSDGVAQLRWTQTGFLPDFGPGRTPRNLMGFRDGTSNASPADAAAMDRVVWVGNEGPEWMRGGSYVVARRIRIALEHWDRMPTAFQEQTIGRHKASGAPLGKEAERDQFDLDATGKDGNPVIPESAHVRLAAAASNGGAEILRRPYSYNDGINSTAERWPPWRQGLEYDAGLFFICYQRDPRSGFIRIFDRMAKLDMLNQFVTHVGGGLFAIPSGVVEGEFLGQKLFQTA